MSTRVSIAVCQRRLAMIWFPLSGLLFAWMIALSLQNKYGDQTQKAWGLFLPMVVPTLTLIIGAVAYGARQPETSDTVDGFAYRLSAGLSLFYLLLVVAVFASQSLVPRKTPTEVMELSNLWLNAVQGLVGLALGIFFGSKESK